MDLDRDMTLVVVQGQHHIKLTGYGPIEHRICRQRPNGLDAIALCQRYCRSQLLYFFPAQQAALAAVGVQGRYSDAGASHPPLA